MDPLPKEMPTPKPKKKPQKGCPECGRGNDLAGYLCSECRGPRPVARLTQGSICEETGDDIPY